MKKFLLIAGGAVIMSAASVWGYSYYQEQTMDPWLKANIAALSSAEDLEYGEDGLVKTVSCYTGTVADERDELARLYLSCTGCFYKIYLRDVRSSTCTPPKIK